MSCDNCTIRDNFAVNGGIFTSETNGFVKLKNSEITQNKAISVGIGEILDSVGLSEVMSTSISENEIVSKAYLESENANCVDLCYIPPAYLDHYVNYIDKLSEINVVQFKIMKGYLFIHQNSSFSKGTNLINSYSSQIDI